MGAYGSYIQLAVGIGGLIYSLVTNKESENPEPQELQVNNYSRNLPVPIVYGTDKVTGTCIYIGNTKAEYVEAGGGKGGFMMIMGLFIGTGPQQQPGWYYSADFCIGLCEGSTYGINNIYLNDISLLDVLDQFSYDFEKGDNTQLINSTISDFLSDGSAIPWRHTSYLWMSGQLGNTNQIPRITAEVSGLLSYRSLPITNKWAPYTPCRIPGSLGSGDWYSYHVTNYYENNFRYNWTFTKGENTVYLITYDGNTYNNASVYVITLEENFQNEAFLILKVSDTQPTWGSSSFKGSPHNQQVRVELIKGTFPIGITRWDNWFGFVDRSSSGETHQSMWSIFKLDSSDPVNNDIWISYEICNTDNNTIYKGDYLHFFTYGNYIEYVGTYYNSYFGDILLFYGLQNAIRSLTDDNGNSFSYLVPQYMSTSTNDVNPCCTKHCLEMWYTHRLYRIRNSTYSFSIASYYDPYFPNIRPVSYDFLYRTYPIMAIGNNERHPKRWVVCQKNYGDYTGNIEIIIWEIDASGKNFSVVYEFNLPWNSYYLYGNYIQDCSIYYSGSWIYMMFNVYISGMPANYSHCMFRFNPYTGVFESSLQVPKSAFRDSHKITKGIGEKILCISSKCREVGAVGQCAFFSKWDAFSSGQDASPIEVCYDFMTNKRYGMGISTSLFDGSPYTSANTTWYNENAYCYENVLNDIPYQVNEPRFLYSNTFDKFKKGFDIVQDILQTCRGFLYYCDGKIKVKIEKGTETPVIYFGCEEVSFLAKSYL